MIIPCPVNFWEVHRYPLTWTIIFLNFFIFFLFFGQQKPAAQWEPFFTEENMILTGRIYDHFLHLDSNHSDPPEWVKTLPRETSESWRTLGALALRDRNFLNATDKVADELENLGDRIAIQKWKKRLGEFKSSYFAQPVFVMGLSQNNMETLSWITYQFSHSGIFHLISNMIYLLIVGTAVEAMVGSAGLVLIYLAGGAAAGMFFLYLRTHGGAVPMVGASGSISALMAYYILFEQRRSIRFTYLVSLHPRHHGAIYLPTLWMIPLFLVSDFSQHLSSLAGLGSTVAHSAHMGGTLFGAGVALIGRYILKLPNGLLKDEIMGDEIISAQ